MADADVLKTTNKRKFRGLLITGDEHAKAQFRAKFDDPIEYILERRGTQFKRLKAIAADRANYESALDKFKAYMKARPDRRAARRARNAALLKAYRLSKGGAIDLADERNNVDLSESSGYDDELQFFEDLYGDPHYRREPYCTYSPKGAPCPCKRCCTPAIDGVTVREVHFGSGTKMFLDEVVRPHLQGYGRKYSAFETVDMEVSSEEDTEAVHEKYDDSIADDDCGSWFSEESYPSY